MIFTQIISALAVFASVSAVEQHYPKPDRCVKPDRAPKCCKGINCLETLARINFQPKWCGAELMEKLARRAILRPDINWNYSVEFDGPVNSPCAALAAQDPSLDVAVLDSKSRILCSTAGIQEFFPNPTTTGTFPGTDFVVTYTTDYSYPVHAAGSTNHVKYVNFNGRTYVAVPLYFKDGTYETVVFAKDNTDLPIVCCDDPNPALTQCRRFL